MYYWLGLYSKGGVDGFTRLALGSLHLGHACTHYPEPGVSDSRIMSECSDSTHGRI